MATSPSENEKGKPEQMGVGLMLGGATGLILGGVASGGMGAAVGGILGALLGQFIEHYEMTKRSLEEGW